jgi:hypothetical protein
LKSLLKGMERAPWVGLVLAVGIHGALTQLRGLRDEQRVAKPLTTQFIKRQPRLTKPMELRKRPQPKRRAVQRQMVAVRAQRHGEAGASKMQAFALAGRSARPSASVSRGVGLGTAEMEPGARYEVSSPTSVGTGVVPGDEIELSGLIGILNERLGTEFKPGDQLFFESIREGAVADSGLRQAAPANTMESFGYVFRKALEGLFIDRMEQDEEITATFMNEDQFREAVGQRAYTLRLRGAAPQDHVLAGCALADPRGGQQGRQVVL